MVVVDYYTKWVEAKPFSSIMEANCTNLIWKNIICLFGILHSLVINGEKQFDTAKTINLCKDLNIN